MNPRGPTQLAKLKTLACTTVTSVPLRESVRKCLLQKYGKHNSTPSRKVDSAVSLQQGIVRCHSLSYQDQEGSERARGLAIAGNPHPVAVTWDTWVPDDRFVEYAQQHHDREAFGNKLQLTRDSIKVSLEHCAYEDRSWLEFRLRDVSCVLEVHRLLKPFYRAEETLRVLNRLCSTSPYPALWSPKLKLAAKNLDRCTLAVKPILMVHNYARHPQFRLSMLPFTQMVKVTAVINPVLDPLDDICALLHQQPNSTPQFRSFDDNLYINRVRRLRTLVIHYSNLLNHFEARRLRRIYPALWIRDAYLFPLDLSLSRVYMDAFGQ